MNGIRANKLRGALAVVLLTLLTACGLAQTPRLREVKVLTEPVSAHTTYKFNVVLKNINLGKDLDVTMQHWSGGSTVGAGWKVTIPFGHDSFPRPAQATAPGPGAYELRATIKLDTGGEDSMSTVLNVRVGSNVANPLAEYLPISRVASAAVKPQQPPATDGRTKSRATSAKGLLLYQIGLDGINVKRDHVIQFAVYGPLTSAKPAARLSLMKSWTMEMPYNSDTLPGKTQHSLKPGEYILMAYRKGKPNEARSVAFTVK